MKMIALALPLLLSLSVTLPSPKTSALNVLLFEGTQVTIGSSAPFYLDERKISPGDYLFTNQRGLVRFEDLTLRKETVIRPVSPLGYLTVNATPYRGTFMLKASPQGLRLINQVSLEEYLYGVVAKEMPGVDLEALKAQAIASRTLATNAFLRGKPMRATISQQFYGGVEGEREIANEAVDETHGMVLTYRGKLVPYPLFSSTCGGTTEDNSDVFGKHIPYLTNVPDNSGPDRSSFCELSPYFSWTVTWDAKQLEEDFETSGIKGEVLDLIPNETDRGGHVKELAIKTTKGEWKIRGNRIRSVLKLPDGNLLYSTRFDISKISDNGRLQFTALGHGKGHGVGLCQWGAIGMARQGKTFQEILKHYYPGTEIGDDLRLLGDR